MTKVTSTVSSLLLFWFGGAQRDAFFRRRRRNIRVCTVRDGRGGGPGSEFGPPAAKRETLVALFFVLFSHHWGSLSSCSLKPLLSLSLVY